MHEILNSKERELLIKLARKIHANSEKNDIKELADKMICLARYTRSEAEDGQGFTAFYFQKCEERRHRGEDVF